MSSLQIFFVYVQPFSTTHFEVASSPPPHTSLKGAGNSNSGPYPSARFEGCTRQHPGLGGNFGKKNLFTKNCKGCSEAFGEGQATPPHGFQHPEHCRFPSLGSADRVRPVHVDWYLLKDHSDITPTSESNHENIRMKHLTYHNEFTDLLV
jgi:hypothetical protein